MSNSGLKVYLIIDKEKVGSSCGGKDDVSEVVRVVGQQIKDESPNLIHQIY